MTEAHLPEHCEGAVSAHRDALDVHETVPGAGSLVSARGGCLGGTARRRGNERAKHPHGWLLQRTHPLALGNDHRSDARDGALAQRPSPARVALARSVRKAGRWHGYLDARYRTEPGTLPAAAQSGSRSGLSVGRAGRHRVPVDRHGVGGGDRRAREQGPERTRPVSQPPRHAACRGCAAGRRALLQLFSNRYAASRRYRCAL